MRLEEARRLIQQLDVPVRQVMIERASSSPTTSGAPARRALRHPVGLLFRQPQLRRLGSLTDTVSPLSNNPLSRGAANLTMPGYTQSFDRGPQGNIPAGGQPEQLNVNLPVVGAAGSLALSILNLGSGNLVNIELSALEADNRGKVVSSPRVITADKKKAVISQGTEIPYETSAASGATRSRSSGRAGARRHAADHPGRPHHHGPRGQEDSVGQIFANIPSIDTKRVTTQVLCDNGDTIVLGGIFEQTTRTTVEKVRCSATSRWWLPLQEDDQAGRQDGTADLRDAKIVKDSLTVR